ncbi:MAG: phosphoribosylanthranilate isomerase [Coprothermobacterota bacterium]|nr:phosphoribosylanthranilate isomerase [Coprothermobacterota bacterium]
MTPSVIRVKICCIQDLEEAQLAIRYGASALGLVSWMPSGPGPIEEKQITAIARKIPPFVTTVLLTSEQDPVVIEAQHRRCRTQAIQLVDSLSRGAHALLRQALPGISLLQVIHVRGEVSMAEAEDVALLPAGGCMVDALLLDSGNPALAVKELGGTGRTHDWRISRRIRDAVKIPVILAGGLNPGNVGEAIQAVRPFAVDVCSGVRTGGRLDESKLAAFMDAVRSAG